MNHAFKPVGVSVSDHLTDNHVAEAREDAAFKNRKEITPEEAEKTLGLAKELRAKYKIEVTFVEGRTMHGPNKCGIQLWESGKRFHGGGDELMYWCKDNRDGENGGCWGAITGDCIKGGVAYCTHCNRAVNPEYLTNMKIGNVTSQNLAKELVKLFRQLDSNADIYIKYHKTDVHYVAMEAAKGPDVARRLKGMHIYTLRNIVTDTAAGADLGKRFFAFLTS